MSSPETPGQTPHPSEAASSEDAHPYPSDQSQQVGPPIPATPEEDVESKIRRIEEMVQAAKSMPLSSSVLVPKEEILMHLADLRESLPQELRQARWILREKDDFIARARREAELIVEEAQSEAARIVSETEIMREAEWKAGLLLSEAEERARSLKAETDGYIDSKLASFETLLRRMLETIVAGRERLRAVPEVHTEPPAGSYGQSDLKDSSGSQAYDRRASASGADYASSSGGEFFDQDQS
jgi:hypothetical protein